MNLRLALRDYRAQRSQAARRGIQFLIPFDDWIAFYEKHLGPNWQELRGKREGQFCMARNGDVGPYALWNVECKLATVNSREANLGTQGVKSYITDALVIEIFKCPGTNDEVAYHFGVGVGVVRGIKARKHYVHLTENLKRVERKPGREGDIHYNIKLRDADVAYIRLSDEPAQILATKFGVGRGHIHDIRKGLKRRNVRITQGGRYRPHIRPSITGTF